MAIYMKWDTLKGTVTAANYDGWIAVDGFSYRTERPTVVESGIGVEGRHVDQAAVQEVFLTRKFDRASTGLMNLMTKKSMGTDVQFHFVDQGEEGPEVRKKVTIVEAFVTGYTALLAEGGGAENLTISFGQMEIEFVNKAESGPKTVRASFNVTQGTVE